MRQKKWKRLLAGLLAAVTLTTAVPGPSAIDALAGKENWGNQDTYWSSTWHYFCIDHRGVASNSHGNDGDLYQCFAPSAGLSESETAMIQQSAGNRQILQPDQ